jgi:hypothetical protein
MMKSESKQGMKNRAFITLEQYRNNFDVGGAFDDIDSMSAVAIATRSALQDLLQDILLAYPEQDILADILPDAITANMEQDFSDENNREHSGWTNWATWNVGLWIGNDEPTYKRWVVWSKRRFEKDTPWTPMDTFSMLKVLFPSGETPDGASILDANLQEISDSWNEDWDNLFGTDVIDKDQPCPIQHPEL